MWLLINHNCFAELGNYRISQLEPQIFVRQFAAAEENGDFDLVPGFQKLCDFAKLDVPVVLADFEPQAHLLDVECLGAALVFLLLLGALVIVLAPVDYFGDGRLCIGGNLYEVEVLLSGELQSFCTREDAKLLAFLVDYPELGSLNGRIQAGVFADKSSPYIWRNSAIVTDV